MAVSPAPDQRITGTVSSVNPKGIRLDGQDGWLNFSKYAPDVVPPMRGQAVTVTLDRQGFVRAVEPTDGSDVTRPSRRAPGVVAGQRDTTITRLAVLKAAAEFAAARPQVKSGEVLKIAASWERWVLRDAGDLDLTDAF